MNQIMKAEYIQPNISVLTVYGKEVVMQSGVVTGSKGSTNESGNGHWGDDTKGRGSEFDEKEVTFGNIW